MAVLVEFAIDDATTDKLVELEALTMARGAAAGGPPYTGCMFIALTPTDAGVRCVSAWRTERAARAVLESMIEPDLATLDLAVRDVRVCPVLSMAIPGTH